MRRCKKLLEVPAVVTEWQETAWCPDCEHYNLGLCWNPAPTGPDALCPLDGRPVPLREIAVQLERNPSGPPADCRTPAPLTAPPPGTALQEAIVQQVRQRTGRRIQGLSVDVGEEAVVVRGCASCFYLKQLALLAVLEVAGTARTIRLDLNVVNREPFAVDDGCDASEIEPTQD